MKKYGRNDPCPCGSGKKFKKCCESTMIGGKFRATKIEPATSASIVSSTSKMANLFQSHVAKPPVSPSKPIVASAPVKEKKGE
jgi:hypothetical protein